MKRFTAPNPALIVDQCAVMSRTAIPIGPVRIASRVFQLLEMNPTTDFTTFPMNLNAVSTNALNHPTLLYASTRAATIPTIAAITRPIGLAVNAAFHNHCAAVATPVATFPAIMATFWPTMLAVDAMAEAADFPAASAHVPSDFAPDSAAAPAVLAALPIPTIADLAPDAAALPAWTAHLPADTAPVARLLPVEMAAPPTLLIVEAIALTLSIPRPIFPAARPSPTTPTAADLAGPGRPLKAPTSPLRIGSATLPMTFTTPVAVRTAPVTPAITDIAVSLICGQLRMNVSAMFLMIGVAVLPTHSTAWPILGIACSPNFCKCGIALSTRPVTAAPTSSFMLSNMRPILAVESADFSAVPPNWVSNSFRMMPWAPVTSPEAIMALTCSFCWAVNWTPALDSEVMPFTGSLRALPSCMLALLASPPSTAAMSNASPVALSNSLPDTFVNVKSTDWASTIS